MQRGLKRIEAPIDRAEPRFGLVEPAEGGSEEPVDRHPNVVRVRLRLGSRRPLDAIRHFSRSFGLVVWSAPCAVGKIPPIGEGALPNGAATSCRWLREQAC